MRPTGPLHIGHYFGALQNWVRLQEKDDHECFFFSADWHAMTTGYRDTREIGRFRREMVADWLAAGLDPERVVIFAQAAVPAHGELATLLGMITPVPWLERVPSYKEIRDELADRDLSTVGFLSYPLLQTADIAVYRASRVPVGEDQLAHVELSRMVLRRFNSYYGEVFPEPDGLVSVTRRLPGLDGRKMSKSYDNALYLGDEAEVVKRKVMSAPTDPQRVRRNDPGDPSVCYIFSYHKLFSSDELCTEVAGGCRSAGIGCVDCKKKLLNGFEDTIGPIRERRGELLAGDNGGSEVDAIIDAGNKRAASEAAQTMEKVRAAIGLS